MTWATVDWYRFLAIPFPGHAYFFGALWQLHNSLQTDASYINTYFNDNWFLSDPYPVPY